MRKFSPRIGAPPTVEVTKASPEIAEEMQNNQQNALELQAVTDDLNDEATTLRTRLSSLGPTACIGYSLLSLDGGVASSEAQFNLRVSDVSSALTLSFESPAQSQYVIQVTNQQDNSTNLFWSREKNANGFEVNATTIGGAIVNLGAGQHNLAILCWSLLPESF